MDDQLSENLEELRANYRNRLAETRQLRERAGRVTSTARSRDGLVSLEVGPQGELLALSLNPGVYDRLSPQRLAAALVDLAKTATADSAEQIREIMAPALRPGGTPDDGVPPTRPQRGQRSY